MTGTIITHDKGIMDTPKLPQMPKPRQASRAFELHYYDAGRRVVYATEQAHVLKEGLLTVSQSDAHGMITQVNRILTDISGFKESELLLMPHCIFRHPDMPAEIFKNMWAKLNAGETWRGYLKNLCKNGNYFWINAHISPTIVNDHIIGYYAVGRAVSDRVVAQFEALYAEMLRQEAQTLAATTPQQKPEKKHSLFGWKK